jgi:Sugar-specific transcriptional regulator TrmB
VLDAVDLDATEQAVYEALLDRSPTTLGDLDAALTLGSERVRAVVATLESRGLVSRAPGAPPRFVAVSPEVALNPIEAELLERGVRYRIIYDAAGLDLHPLHEDLETSIAQGEESRVLSDTPTKLLLIDDRFGLVPLWGEPATVEGMVVVHPSGLLDALSSLFEALWERALPLRLPAGAHSSAEPGAPTHDAGWSGRRAGRLAGQQQPDGQQHGEDGARARGQTHAALLVSPLTRRGEGTLRTRPGHGQSSRRQVRAVVVNPPPAARPPSQRRPAQWARMMACWRTVNRLPAAR